MTKNELLERLPRKEFWFTREIAEAYGISTRAIQYAAKRNGIGRKVRQGPKGTYVFQDEDLDRLVLKVHGEVGNPVNIAMCRARLLAVQGE
jgi:DNA-binding transcriptional MerR regulator